LDNLIVWKSDKYRKPLIIRGARQVGKSTLVRQFGESFRSFIEINLEKQANKELFAKSDDVVRIKNELLFNHNVLVDNPEEILIFLDEIQECPQAIKILRYFYEELPDYRVIAAGSLLDFAMEEIGSFPVGRVEQMVLHPVSFEEFLEATNNLALIEYKTLPPNNYIHSRMMSLFHLYINIGGIPEAVAKYLETKNINITSKVYDQLWQTYIDDIEKYATSRSEREVLRYVITHAHTARDRVKFENFGDSHYKSRDVGNAFRTLKKARIINLIYPDTNLTPPMNEDLKKRPRIQFLDVGLLNRLMQNHSELLNITDLNALFKGKITQQIVTQELISRHDAPSYQPSFWVRENANANAELDLVYQYRNLIVPIEIKSGPTGILRSLHQFIDTCPHHYAIRIYAGEFNVVHQTTPGGKPYLLLNIPYYMSGRLPEYIAWFIDEFEKSKP
jgi:predicted AAA+ superfamily ATPase